VAGVERAGSERARGTAEEVADHVRAVDPAPGVGAQCVDDRLVGDLHALRAHVEYHDADDESGILTEQPVAPDLAYNILEPAVDADGNDIDGVRSTTLQAPLGTYMGWNYRAAGFGEGDLCDLTGSFIPFAGTQAQRIANGDPRLSLHERYGNNAGYVAAVTAAANNLVSEGLLLPDDATSIINTAKSVSIP